MLCFSARTSAPCALLRSFDALSNTTELTYRINLDELRRPPAVDAPAPLLVVENQPERG